MTDPENNPRKQQRTLSELDAHVRSLETKVAELQDLSALQNLRFRYHLAVNEKSLDAIHLLFTKDAEVHFEGIGSAKGHAEISRLYNELVGGSPFIKQFIHNHMIHLDGDTASGSSYLDARTVRDGESILVAARFDDEYLRLDGEWRFKTLRLSVAFAVPLHEGWAPHVS